MRTYALDRKKSAVTSANSERHEEEHWFASLKTTTKKAPDFRRGWAGSEHHTLRFAGPYRSAVVPLVLSLCIAGLLHKQVCSQVVLQATLDAKTNLLVAVNREHLRHPAYSSEGGMEKTVPQTQKAAL